MTHRTAAWAALFTALATGAVACTLLVKTSDLAGASAAGEAAASKGCPPDGAVTFCDDFDHGLPAQVWDSKSLGYVKGTIDTDPYDAAPSPPNTLLVDVPFDPEAGSFVNGPILTRTFNGEHDAGVTYKTLVVSYDMHVEDITPDNSACSGCDIFSPFYLTLVAEAGTAYAYVDQGDLRIGVGGAGEQIKSFFDRPDAGAGGWLHTELTIDVQSHTATVAFDGAVQAMATLEPNWPSSGVSIALSMGAGVIIPPMKLHVRYDNVILDAKSFVGGRVLQRPLTVKSQPFSVQEEAHNLRGSWHRRVPFEHSYIS
jgi:hypothetical protein